MKLTQYLLAVMMLGACTTQACLARAPKSISKPTGSAGVAVNAAGRQSSGASGLAVSAKSAIGAKSGAGNPIEMAVPEPRRAPTNSKPMDWKKIGIVGVPPTSSQSGAGPALPGPSRRQNAAPGTGGVSTHAIRPVSPVLTATGPAGGAGARTALGATVSTPQAGATVNVGRQGAIASPAHGQVPIGGAGSIARNAVGMPAVGSSLAATARGSGPVLGRPTAAPALPSATTAMNRAVISGSTIARPAPGPVTVGGRATNAATAINGTGLRPKHP